MVLASASPRRSELLARLGMVFDVRPAEVDEAPLAGEDPVDLVRRLALAKAEAGLAAAAEPDVVVLAADTVVVLDGAVRGGREPVEHAHQHGRGDESEVDDDVPHQHLALDLLGLHELAQQVDRGDRHDGRGHLELQRAGIELAP